MNFRVYSAGSNARGQLGNGTIEDACTFAAACPFPKSVDSMWASASDNLRPLDLIPCVSKIATGANHSLVLFNSTGHVYGAGDNSRGQLLTTSPETTSFERVDLDLKQGYQVVDVAAGWETSYFVQRHRPLAPSPPPVESDLLVAIGSNDFGALGVRGIDPPASVSALPTPKGKEKKSIPSSPSSSQQQTLSFNHLLPRETESTYRISTIATGLNHIILILDVYSKDRPPSQLIVGWGSCRHGQLGPASSSFSNSPATLKPALNPPKSASQQLKPKPKPKPRQPTSKSNLTTPQPPSFIPTPTVLQVKNPSPVKQVAAGSQHTVFLHQDGTLTTWGSHRKNQLPSTHPPQVLDVECTWNGTYLVTNPSRHQGYNPNWNVLATGSGEKGQLGRAAPSSSSSTPSPSSSAHTLSSSDLLPVDLPSTSNLRIRKLACGSEHVLLLLENETDGTTDLYVWGWNEHGNLGLNNNQDVFTPCRLPWTGRGRIVDVWAGCGTSWLVVEEDD
ncbi:hypothetical protein M407DRAFT_229407 [Tulasnella calospora MUT 4182]|uniref:RCC1-like domain-containing protein n=1 Tax=Tulasnella calospora MUT 4182 TaxID=1051891 RepID=A0A0C3L4T7_9AGAM|nr:hypothetical protein M407DRAFT_229407 [Tulasnella calospora MUT 4182]